MRTLRRSGPLFIAALMAACGGKGCSCMKPIPGGFPTDSRRHENGVQLRVTGGAFDYLSQNGAALVSSLVGGGMGAKFNVPPSCGGSNQVCCLNGTPQTCTLDIGVESFNLTPNPGANALSFDVTTTLKSEMPIPITINQSGITASCYFALDTAKGPSGKQFIELTGDLDFAVDMTTDLTKLKLNNPKLNDLDQSMLDITAQSGFGNQLACGVANTGFIKNLIIQQLQSQLTGQIGSSVDDALCMTCMAQPDCDAWADACKSGKCQRMGSCLQEIGAQGKLDVGGFLAGISPSTQAAMDILTVLGGYATVTPSATPGLSLGALAGGQADPHSACVPMRDPPMFAPITQWSQVTGETDPRDGKPYHVGVGIHQSDLNLNAFAAFDSGALCLAVGTPSVPQLSASTLSVIIPSLSDLTHNEPAPMFIVLRPGQEPTLTIGQGTFKVDMNGNKTIDDPLLHVALPKLSIDFYAFVDERYVRVMTLTSDVMLPVSLDVDDKGQLVPLIGDVSKAFTNISVTNSELLAESPDQLAKVFPTLLGLAAGQLGGNLKPIALPSVMGLAIKPVAVEPVDNLSYLAIFADLDLGTHERFHASTAGQVLRVEAPPTSAFSVAGGLDPARAPRAILSLGGQGLGGDASDLEWSTAIDDGAWSPFDARTVRAVSDPTLWLQGKHHALVRARVAGEPETTDPTPIALDFIVDTIAPVGTVERDGDTLRFVAHDNVTVAGALTYSWSKDGGATWTPFSTASTLVVGKDLGEQDLVALEVIARDEAGNDGALDFHGRETGSSSGGCGCAVGGHARGDGAATLFAIALFVALVARRRVRLLVALLLLAGACDDSAATVNLLPTDYEPAMDEIGRFSDARAHAGTIKISAYDDTMGDLAYAEVPVGNAGKQAIQWQWVDGVPTGESKDPTVMSRGGISDPGDDVGRYTSLALDGNGNPHIAYFDVTHGALKYASAGGDRKFKTSVVDMPAAPALAGMYTSISLDAGGVPSIAYAATNLSDNNGGFVGKLRLATAKSPSPAGPGDWNILDVDTVAVPCAGTGKDGLCGAGQACVLTDPTKSKLKSTCRPVDTSCTMKCGSGTACVAGACTPVLGPVAAPDFIEGTGLFANLVRTPSGARAIVYYDRESGSLYLELETGAGVFSKALLDGNDPAKDVGQFATASVSPDGVVHVAYVDAIADHLLYREAHDTMATMAELVDDGVRDDGLHPVGGGASILADASGVRLVYQDQATADLWAATRAGSTWTKTALRTGAPGYGFYPHVVADGGKHYVTDFLYDRASTGALGSLEIVPLP